MYIAYNSVCPSSLIKCACNICVMKTINNDITLSNKPSSMGNDDVHVCKKMYTFSLLWLNYCIVVLIFWNFVIVPSI